MDNEIVYTGTHTIMIRKGREKKPEEHYWTNYAFEGHIMRMNRPKKGQWVRLPFGELCKIVNLGTERLAKLGQNKGEDKYVQYPAVYVVQVPG